jgi:hypothetical protein
MTADGIVAVGAPSMKPVPLALLLGCLLGVPAGVGAFTFVYAKGLSYLSTDPRAYVNCHAMNSAVRSASRVRVAAPPAPQHRDVVASGTDHAGQSSRGTPRRSSLASRPAAAV